MLLLKVGGLRTAQGAVTFQLRELRTELARDSCCCLSSTGQQGVSTDNAGGLDQAQKEHVSILTHHHL